jgi:AcrR family transcriptional regulator
MNTAVVPAPPGQRARILDTALTLMAERGAGDTSMRTLAKACGLNVATLYHYFPSKADLFRSVIAERGYFDLLATEGSIVDRDLPVDRRLVELLRCLWEGAVAEVAPVRLILGEGLRGEPTATTTVTALLAAIDAAMTRWLNDDLPELPGDPGATARVLRQLLVARLIEHLVAGTTEQGTDEWAEEVASVILAA